VPPAATATWAPGDEELEQAALAVSLLARLPGALLPPSGAGAGAGAAATGNLSGLRRDLWRLWLVLAGSDRDSSSGNNGMVSSGSALSAGPVPGGSVLRRHGLGVACYVTRCCRWHGCGCCSRSSVPLPPWTPAPHLGRRAHSW
jgi:hypothetical protein